MNIVDMYRIKNNKFNWSELFAMADDTNLNVIQALLIAEMQKRRTSVVYMPNPTPYIPNTVWSDRTWQVELPYSTPGVPNRNGNVYIGDPLPGYNGSIIGNTADIRVMFDGQEIGTMQSVSFNDGTVSFNNK